MNSTPLPASELLVTKFITHIFNEGRPTSSIRSILSAVGYFHKISGLPSPTNSYLVSKLLIGTSRIRPRSDNRLPILSHILKRLVSATTFQPDDNYSNTLMRAVYTLMFYAFLRIGEVAVDKNTELTNLIQIDDLQLFQSNGKHTSMSVTFRHFKHHLGKLMTLKITARQGITCPVAAMAAYLSLRGNSTGPLFLLSNGRPLTKYYFSRYFKATLLQCRLDPSLYKSHSFRIGAATACAQKGIPFDVIRRLGRWKSDAFLNYIRIPTYTY